MRHMVTPSSSPGRALTRISLMMQAFNSELKPYADFEWVTSPTSRRHLARNASQPPAWPPATTTTSVAGAFKRAEPPQDNHRPRPVIAESIKAEPPLNAPRGPRNNIPSRAPQFFHLHPDIPKGPTRHLVKAPTPSGEAHLSPSSRSSSMQPQKFADSRASSTTSSSVSSSWDPPELFHPSQRLLMEKIGPLNAAARDQSFAQSFDHPGRAHFSPESTRSAERLHSMKLDRPKCHTRQLLAHLHMALTHPPGLPPIPDLRAKGLARLQGHLMARRAWPRLNLVHLVCIPLTRTCLRLQRRNLWPHNFREQQKSSR